MAQLITPRRSMALAAFPDRSPLEPGSTVVPMEVVDGRAIVPVKLNGRLYRLAVETGSPNLRLSVAAVRDLGLRSVGVDQEEDSLFHLDSLRMGDVLVNGLRVGRGDEVVGLGVDGVSGSTPTPSISSPSTTPERGWC